MADASLRLALLISLGESVVRLMSLWLNPSAAVTRQNSSVAQTTQGLGKQSKSWSWPLSAGFIGDARPSEFEETLYA